MSQITSPAKPRYDRLKVTREEYLDLEEDGFLYDMIDGVLYMSPSAFVDHNDVLSEIVRLLRNYFYENKSGKAIVETDIYLPDGDDVLRPDISVILKENYNILKGHIHGVPDMVVEVLSNSTRERDLGVKADRYLKNGVKEYWIANLDDKTIQVWINQPGASSGAGNAIWEKKIGDVIQSQLLAGFEINSERIFEE